MEIQILSEFVVLIKSDFKPFSSDQSQESLLKNIFELLHLKDFYLI